MKDAPCQRTRTTYLKNLTHQLGSQKSRKFHRNRIQLADVSTRLVYYFCCIYDSGNARASVKIQQK